jgi:integrase
MRETRRFKLNTELKLHNDIETRIEKLPEHYKKFFIWKQPNKSTRRHTIKSYLLHLNKVEDLLGKKLMEKKGAAYVSVTKDELVQLKDTLSHKLNHKPSSVNAYLASIKSIFKYWTQELEIVEKSPIPLDFQEEEPYAEKEMYITEEHLREINNILDELVKTVTTKIPASMNVTSLFFHALQRKAIIRLMIDTGARVGEIAGITANDFDRYEIMIDKRKHKQWQVKIYNSKKRDGSPLARWLPISKETKKAVDEMLYHAQLKIKNGELPLSTANFSKAFHRKNRSRAIQTWINEIQKDLNKMGYNIPKLTPHHFRHLFATRLILAGENDATVQKMLGQKNIQSIIRYVKASNQMAGAASYRTFGF